MMKTRSLLIAIFASVSLSAQTRTELVPMGDFESWSVQSIKESVIIGGKTRSLFSAGYPWGSSNAHAKVFGITKVSVSVWPEERGNGWCCCMKSTLEDVKALGIDFQALATGTVYTGKMMDVVGIKQSSDPNSAIDMGMPFTKRPSALVLDYKSLILNKKAVYADASVKVKEVSGHDKGQIIVILQHRWEENGHVYAHRVGTAHYYIDKTTDWINDFRVPIVYGEATESDLALSQTRHKTHNKAGKMVYIEEKEWRGDLQPTHIIIQVSAGCMAPFTGCPGNTVWCDNIRLEYEE